MCACVCVCAPTSSAWRAPETFTTGDTQVASPRTDVFMFGCFMLEVLTGREPWWWLPSNEALLLHRAVDGCRNPLDDAAECGALAYSLTPGPVSGARPEDLEPLMRWCMAADPRSGRC